jgi:hypothetical protein
VDALRDGVHARRGSRSDDDMLMNDVASRRYHASDPLLPQVCPKIKRPKKQGISHAIVWIKFRCG